MSIIGYLRGVGERSNHNRGGRVSVPRYHVTGGVTEPPCPDVGRDREVGRREGRRTTEGEPTLSFGEYRDDPTLFPTHA